MDVPATCVRVWSASLVGLGGGAELGCGRCCTLRAGGTEPPAAVDDWRSHGLPCRCGCRRERGGLTRPNDALMRRGTWSFAAPQCVAIGGVCTGSQVLVITASLRRRTSTLVASCFGLLNDSSELLRQGVELLRESIRMQSQPQSKVLSAYAGATEKLYAICILKSVRESTANPCVAPVFVLVFLLYALVPSIAVAIIPIPVPSLSSHCIRWGSGPFIYNDAHGFAACILYSPLSEAISI
ncbi:hypothetical protein MVEN_00028000 [Mycena venus]|uniref:Uncharacterized protein n=1 Tax=Mycena venus TaxID=2733690 RepID=A0A8H6Z334_9AGAR|nr:hypothetical protein MVEN_00028000 [Mycena venus]